MSTLASSVGAEKPALVMLSKEFANRVVTPTERIATVGDQTIFAADVLPSIDQLLAKADGQIPPDQRLSIVSQVQEGKIQVLVATLQLISEGFDCSGLSSLFLTTPITFEGRLLQVIGRIMRPAANKSPRVYDYVDEKVAALRRSAAARQKVLANL